MRLFDPASLCGKTSPAHSAATPAATSKPSSRRSSGSSNPKPPMCLCLIGGGWNKAGCLVDALGRFSVAWRLHDAQFWGVPQRRKRIALVADFGGLAAPEVLFERKGVSRHPEPGSATRKGTAGTTADRARKTGCYCLQGNGIDRADTAGCNGRGWSEDVSYTLNTIDRPAVLPFDTTQISSPTNRSNPQYGDPCFTLCKSAEAPAVAVKQSAGFKHKASDKAGSIGYESEKAPTLIAGQEVAVLDARGNGSGGGYVRP